MATVSYNITDADPSVTITITDPDGTETTTTADESGSATITLNKEGEWTFSYEVGGETTTASRTVTADELADPVQEPEPTIGTDAILHITEKQFQRALIRILQKNNERIVAHITDRVKEGDTNLIPSGDAVYKAIQKVLDEAADAGSEAAKDYTDEKIDELTETVLGINNWKYEAITGDLPEDPDTKTIYLQRDDEDDPTYIMKIYSNGKWIDIGDTSLDLVEYWKKDNIGGLTDALLSDPYFMSMLCTGKKDVTTSELVPQTVTVTGAEPGSTITATHTDGTEYTATVGDGGTCTIDLDKAGTWTTTYTKEDGTEDSVTTTVVENVISNVEKTLDERYFPKGDISELIDAVKEENTFFDRTNNIHYADLWSLLGTSEYKTDALANTSITDDETAIIKTAAIDALDNLKYIRHAVLAELLGIENPESVTELSKEDVKEAITVIVKEAADDLESTFVTDENFKDLLGIGEGEDLDKETFETKITEIVDKHIDELTAITDERLDELMNVAFEETALNLANAGIATDEEVQAQIDSKIN